MYASGKDSGWSLLTNVIQRPSSLLGYREILRGDHFQRNRGLQRLAEVVDSLLQQNPRDKASIRVHQLTTLRLSNVCPYEDVREVCKRLFEQLKTTTGHISAPHDSPSQFIDASHLAFDKLGGEACDLAEQLFLSTGRLPNIFRVLLFFPGFLQPYWRAFDFIMRNPGPLALTLRHYIAIMAASRHNCEALVSLQQFEFINSGGDVTWLDGLHRAPRKLQRLASINAHLAHQPWLIRGDDMMALVRGGDDSWTISELIQAIVILTTFHGIAGLCLGMGIFPEVDLMDCEQVPRADSNTSSVDAIAVAMNQDRTSELLERLRTANFMDDDGNVAEGAFEKCGSSDISSEEFEHPRTSSNEFTRYLGDAEISYQDFKLGSKDYKVFRLQDYCWELQGYSSINSYLPKFAELLEAEFSVAQNMTRNHFSDNKDIDTHPFRQAIWYYVLRLAGMSHDDYDYRQVNIFLTRELKSYIKKVACTPETVQKSDFLNMGVNFYPSEKCHINILIFEARRQAALLYALCALTSYLDHHSRH